MTLKQKALRDLNTRHQSVQVALNQAQTALNHALRLVEADYHKKRTEIMHSNDLPPGDLWTDVPSVMSE